MQRLIVLPSPRIFTCNTWSLQNLNFNFQAALATVKTGEVKEITFAFTSLNLANLFTLET